MFAMFMLYRTKRKHSARLKNGKRLWEGTHPIRMICEAYHDGTALSRWGQKEYDVALVELPLFFKHELDEQDKSFQLPELITLVPNVELTYRLSRSNIKAWIRLVVAHETVLLDEHLGTATGDIDKKLWGRQYDALVSFNVLLEAHLLDLLIDNKSADQLQTAFKNGSEQHIKPVYSMSDSVHSIMFLM
jgi:hypothetical protein